MYSKGEDVPSIEHIQFKTSHEVWAWEMFLMIYMDVKRANIGVMRAVLDYCEFYGLNNWETRETIYQFVREAMPDDKVKNG